MTDAWWKVYWYNFYRAIPKSSENQKKFKYPTGQRWIGYLHQEYCVDSNATHLPQIVTSRLAAAIEVHEMRDSVRMGGETHKGAASRPRSVYLAPIVIGARDLIYSVCFGRFVCPRRCLCRAALCLHEQASRNRDTRRFGRGISHDDWGNI